MKKAGNAVWTAVLLALAGIFVLFPQTSHAAGETYQTALEKSYGDTFRSVYENRLAGSPLETEEIDGVDPATGHLILNRTDLSLEGNGGMDFELNRYYDSNEANLGHATVEHVSELEVDTVWVNYTAEDGSQRSIVVNAAILSKHKNALKDLLVTYQKGEGHRGVSHNGEKDIVKNTQRTKIVSGEGHNVYGLASGWRFDFPWIETATLTEKEGWGKIPAYLHYGSAGVINIQSEENSSTKSYAITGLEGYEYQDIKLEDFDQAVDGIPCRYVLRDKTGLRSYFNADGVIVLQKDAHDNTITFTYRDGIYFDTITDSVGRKIVFHYDNVGSGIKALSSVTVQGTSIAGGVSQKTIRYQTEKQSYTPLHGEKLTGLTLTSATVDGSKETYSYKTVERLVSTAGEGVASQRVSTNQSYLLNKVSADGGEQHYEYRACPLRGQNDTGAGKVRDVVTEQFYVTREYVRDSKTGKRSGGQKYDYFQKQGDSLISYADFEENKNEVWQYGRSGLQTVTVVSSFNANKYKANGKYDDYKYKKSNINGKTLRLKKNTTKSVSLYIYNENKMLQEEVSYGKIKEETYHQYDQGGRGSLVTEETDKSYGKSGKAVTRKRGYTYDPYRNVCTEKDPKAYLAKYKDKSHFFTTVYTYHGTSGGYPSDCSKSAVLNQISTQEHYLNARTKMKTETFRNPAGTNVIRTTESICRDGASDRVRTVTESTYDKAGNVTGEIEYPLYGTSGKKESIRYEYAYNALGQQTKTTKTTQSEKYPGQNGTIVLEETTYDSFGNELSSVNEKGMKTTYRYHEETGEEAGSVTAVGTAQESHDDTYTSEDSLKTMTLDSYERCTVQIQDGLGNTMIEKDEKAGTWTESEYEYRDEGGETDEDAEESDSETQGLLVEERTYAFDPTEEKVIVRSTGEKEYNYDIAGRGKEILSGKRYVYDEDGEQIGSAEFSGGAIDAAHCAAWSFTKTETEVEEGRTIHTSWTKELNPAAYQEEVNREHYYTQFDSHILKETITETITDEEGNQIASYETIIGGKDRQEKETSFEVDDFGKETAETTVTKRFVNGKQLPEKISRTEYTYDDLGNVIQTIQKEKKDKESDWESQITKEEYNELGHKVASYDPKGAEEGYATQYEYDLEGKLIKTSYPMEKKDGEIVTQIVENEYDMSGTLIRTREQQTENTYAETYYSYDIMGNLTLVKNALDEDRALYAQYVYDNDGNKIRQFTGLTKPLTLSLKPGKGENSYEFMGKTYHLDISGKAKKDPCHETKYTYNKRNQLTKQTNPEGDTESYRYDVYGNLIETTDYKKNVTKNRYDFQNRLVKTEAADQDTKKTVEHTWEYDEAGHVRRTDNTDYTCDPLSGQITKERTVISKKSVEKTYEYDSSENMLNFTIKIDGNKKLAQSYDYDGFGRLLKVSCEKDGKEESAAQYTYDSNGNLSGKETEAGTASYQYNAGNFVVSVANKSGSEMVSSYQADYTRAGKKQSEHSEKRGMDGQKEKERVIYTYDRLGRLIKEEQKGADAITYIYDAANNRTEMSVGNKRTAYKYNKNDELIRTDTLNTDTETDSVTIYKNDKNGNQLAVVTRESTQGKKEYFDLDLSLGANRIHDNAVYHYNALNQLTESLVKDKKVLYEYDASGLRTKKTVNGKETNYIWDGDQIVLELDNRCNVKKRFIRGTAGDLIYMDEGEGTEKQYYVTDLHGNVVQLIDVSGRVTKTYEYDAFGNENKPDRKDENPFRYCGEYFDSETKSVYLRARYYAPELGRFRTRDTYTGEEEDLASLHLYTYCDNDGVNQVDPSGHDSYVIYDKNARAGDKKHVFAEEAKIMKGKLRRLNRKPCHLLGVKNAKEFKRAWGKLGKRLTKSGHSTSYKVSVDFVYIILHGSIGGPIENATGYMYFSDGNKGARSNIYVREEENFFKEIKYKKERDVEVSKLPVRKMRCIIFSCCNTANPDCENIADAFIKRMKVKAVVGFDGGAYFNYDKQRLEKGTGSQPTWNKYVGKGRFVNYIGFVPYVPFDYDEPVRERMGIRTYSRGRWSAIRYNEKKRADFI